MTGASEVTGQESVGSSAVAQQQKRKFSSTTFLILLICLALLGYFGFQYWRSYGIFKSQSATSQIDDENDIFDISDDHKIGQDEYASDNSDGLSDLAVNEFKEHVRENGSDFVYKILLRNQIAVNDLRAEVRSIREEFNRYKSQEQISKIIFAYVSLREEIFSTKRDRDYSGPLKNFVMLAATDKILKEKALNLTSILSSSTSSDAMIKGFDEVIPYLIAAKNNNPNGNLVDKIRNNLSRLVVVRKLDERSETVDGLIAKTEKALRNKTYQDALGSFSILYQKYLERTNDDQDKTNKLLSDLLQNINIASRLQEVDQDIMSYLKNLSQ